MKAPKYTDANLGDAAQCSICGCLTTDFDRHTSFHEGLVRMLEIEVDD
jgi:hypothetical protein